MAKYNDDNNIIDQAIDKRRIDEPNCEATYLHGTVLGMSVGERSYWEQNTSGHQ